MCILLRGGSNARIMCPMLISSNKAATTLFRGSQTTWMAYPTVHRRRRSLTTPSCSNSSVKCDAGDQVARLQESVHSGWITQVGTVAMTWSKLRVSYASAYVFFLRMQLTWCSQLTAQHTSYSTRRVAPRLGVSAEPREKFFLQTAAECMRRVNAECDKTGANRAKTSMVHCGLDVGADGVWKVEQLGKDLQEIIAEYPDEFRKGI
ncbi:hypothetical protein GQ600_13178 [Phytophthora cactorum]|nr:hypothetical protein GQ600_13178 [Phytophthora cactorum]